MKAMKNDMNDDVLNVIVCLPILGKRPKEGRSGDKKNMFGIVSVKELLLCH